jgi:phosphoglycolate phosphatase-like HAD superfamily hydrolase
MKMNKLLIFDLQGTLVRTMRPPVLNGKCESIDRLSRDYQLALFTGALKAETYNILQELELYPGYFNDPFIVTASSDFPSKPDPAGIEYLSGLADFDKVIYVGDTGSDLAAAKSADIDFVYFGKRKWGKLQVKNIDELAKIL